MSQRQILKYLGRHGDLSPEELAVLCKIGVPSIRKGIVRLKKEGLIEVIRVVRLRK